MEADRVDKDETRAVNERRRHAELWPGGVDERAPCEEVA